MRGRKREVCSEVDTKVDVGTGGDQPPTADVAASPSGGSRASTTTRFTTTKVHDSTTRPESYTTASIAYLSNLQSLPFCLYALKTRLTSFTLVKSVCTRAPPPSTSLSLPISSSPLLSLHSSIHSISLRYSSHHGLNPSCIRQRECSSYSRETPASSPQACRPLSSKAPWCITAQCSARVSYQRTNRTSRHFQRQCHTERLIEAVHLHPRQEKRPLLPQAKKDLPYERNSSSSYAHLRLRPNPIRRPPDNIRRSEPPPRAPSRIHHPSLVI